STGRGTSYTPPQRPRRRHTRFAAQHFDDASARRVPHAHRIPWTHRAIGGVEDSLVSALGPDYDSHPGPPPASVAPRDVHDGVGAELDGSVLDIGCGEGRLVDHLPAGVAWVGVDASPEQIAQCPWRPLVLGDMRRLPFADNSFAAVTHLWCLYHLDDP